MDSLELLMTYASDGLLVLTTLGAAVFCLVLSRRLSRLSRIDNGLGGAIAVLSAQVDDMNKALDNMKSDAGETAERLEGLTQDARKVAEDLDLMLAACHDMPSPHPQTEPDAQTPSDAPREDAEPELLFGTRRRAAAAPEESVTIPFFLKNRSRLLGHG